MIRLVTHGRFTHDYAKGLVAAPEDREPAVRKLIEEAGGKLDILLHDWRLRFHAHL